jgi:hypothetical protein
MKYKTIISTISFSLISMFYVSSASAGPTYLNVRVAPECGKWGVSPGAQHCRVRGSSVGMPGGTAYFKCEGGRVRTRGVGIDTQFCGRSIFCPHMKTIGSPDSNTQFFLVKKGGVKCTVIYN